MIDAEDDEDFTFSSNQINPIQVLQTCWIQDSTTPAIISTNCRELES